MYAVPGLANGALNSKELPTRIKVLNWGQNKTLKGIFTVDERTLRVFDQNQRQSGWDTIALDYEHNTVPGTTAYRESKEPRPVAAHLSCTVVPNEGLFCGIRDWTEGDTGGKANAKNYADLSAAPISEEVNGEFVVIGLHSVALTQHGASDAQFLSGELPADLTNKIHTLSASFNSIYVMNNPTVATFRAFLGMDDTASDADVMSAMAEKIKKKELSCRTGPLDNAGGTMPKVEGLSADAVAKIVADALKPISANVTALSAASETAAKNAETAEKAGLVAEFAKQGKVCPLSADDVILTPVSVIKSVLAATPKANVSTHRSPQPLMKNGATGRIQGNPGVTTLAVNGVPVTLSIGGGNGQPEPKINATRSNFQEQFDALNRK